MLRLIPVIADAMAMTTVTPMATPRMVSAARTLLARIESRAMADALGHPGKRASSGRPAHSARSATIGIEAGGAARRVDPGAMPTPTPSTHADARWTRARPRREAG